MLPRIGYTNHTKFNERSGHYLVVDTNVVLSQVSRSSLHPNIVADYQIDLLVALPANLPLIVPSTTLQETRHRSLPLYNRLHALVQDEERTVWVWWNEARRETATVPQVKEGHKEGPNDQNDRGELLASETANEKLSERHYTSTINICEPLSPIHRISYY